MTPTMTKLFHSAALIAGLAMLPGCPLLDVEADVPEVCLTYPNIQIETPELPSVAESFVFDDLSAVHDLVEQEADLQFTRAELRVTSGIDNLSFVDAVKIIVSTPDPGSALPPLTMYHCDGDCMPEGNSLQLSAADASNAAEYLKSDSIQIDVDFRGRIPAAAWSLDIDVCITGRASHSVSL